MLDVHAPHGKVEGWKDFFVHLFTITIGLLIALGLEGCVEWQHHRHLAAESKDALRGEIAPIFYHRSGELLGLPERFEEAVRKLTRSVCCIGCRHTHVGIAPSRRHTTEP